jgi:hypothetical protein
MKIRSLITTFALIHVMQPFRNYRHITTETSVLKLNNALSTWYSSHVALFQIHNAYLEPFLVAFQYRSEGAALRSLIFECYGIKTILMAETDKTGLEEDFLMIYDNFAFRRFNKEQR